MGLSYRVLFDNQSTRSRLFRALPKRRKFCQALMAYILIVFGLGSFDLRAMEKEGELDPRDAPLGGASQSHSASGLNASKRIEKRKPKNKFLADSDPEQTGKRQERGNSGTFSTSPMNLSPTQSSSDSPRTGSPRKTGFALWLFDEKRLPLHRIDLGAIGEITEEKMMQKLNSYSLDIIIFIDAKSADSFDGIFKNQTSKDLKDKLKISYDIAHPSNYTGFVKLLKSFDPYSCLTEQNNEECQKLVDDQNSIELSNTATSSTNTTITPMRNKELLSDERISIGLVGINYQLAYTYLSRWTAERLIEDAFKRGSKMFRHEYKLFSYDDILKRDDGKPIIVDQILNSSYMRLFGSLSKRKFYITDDDYQKNLLECSAKIGSLNATKQIIELTNLNNSGS